MKKKHFYLSLVMVIVAVGILTAVISSGKGKIGSVESSSEVSGNIQFENAIGKRAPDFELENTNGAKVSLKQLRGKAIVLFFNEGSMCYPACWNQVKELAADQRLNNDQIQAYSIVDESKGAWQSIMKKQPEYSTDKMLFDTSRKVSLAYDVLSLPSSMHKGAFPGHTYIVIDKEGIIRYVLDDPSMAIRNDQILAEAQKI